MTALLIENFKLVLLALLIGSIVGLSCIGGAGPMTSAPKRLPRPFVR